MAGTEPESRNAMIYSREKNDLGPLRAQFAFLCVPLEVHQRMKRSGTWVEHRRRFFPALTVPIAKKVLSVKIRKVQQLILEPASEV
ncbi:hypothetical protein NDU88_003434 [Pleurodeles waltl]|uniref:Uncharacterized protein n=1 Tax=Pleurodeles waltl TaxID=8319 RepID=A0AAV7SFP9_PLEWA|nr:hypothetical protein NDU88_003434 [Pleurodeles waltl]